MSNGTDDRFDLVVVGSGLGGLSAALTAADLGLSVCVIEKSAFVGGASAFSGGQVWIPGNHVEARLGIEDSIEAGLRYVADVDGGSGMLRTDVASQWLEHGPVAARWLEDQGIVAWDVMPDYPDYYHGVLASALPAGRYITGRPFHAAVLGEWEQRVRRTPYFPSGLTYAEMFATQRGDHTLADQRRAEHLWTFGMGLIGALLAGALERGVRILTEHSARQLLRDGDSVTGVEAKGPDGSSLTIGGAVVLATSGYDWSPELMQQYSNTPASEMASIAPTSLTGDAFELAGAVGASVTVMSPAEAAYAVGYRIAPPSVSDPGFRTAYECMLPHAFLIDASGRRFADDAFFRTISSAVLGDLDGDGRPVHRPFYMVFDEQHHRRYGLGTTPPGGAYPSGLVTEAPSLAALARAIGVDPAALEATATRFNTFAERGVDDDFGRGSNAVSRRYGDQSQQPNPNLGTVAEPPFRAVRLYTLSAATGAAGITTGLWGQVLDDTGSPIPRLYAVGSCASYTPTCGVGYNSGYSLSRALTFGSLAAHHLAKGASQ